MKRICETNYTRYSDPPGFVVIGDEVSVVSFLGCVCSAGTSEHYHLIKQKNYMKIFVQQKLPKRLFREEMEKHYAVS